MTYQVLARKWRPSSFSEMVGQRHVLKTLIHALDNERLHHAYLFTGTRGVGKTTIARILAKCLNCEKGVTSTPCGECSACVEIAQGRFIDLIEVDAASRTKVEDTRELLENVQYAPSRGRFKVYLVDEVHMLSGHSFNALLKTLEEPPPHVKFLFATTDPHKLPITILSRCLQFNLKNMSPKNITDYLQAVLTQERIEFEEAALWHLARAAQGSMRDALTLLDQSISFGDGGVSESSVRELLGTPDEMVVFKLIKGLKDNAPAEILALIREVAEQTPDYMKLLDELISVLHRIAIAQVLTEGIDNSQGDREQILSLARGFTAEDVQLYYQIALRGREDMAIAGDLRMAFEMLLLRMLVFTPQLTPQLTTNEEKKEEALQEASEEPAAEKKKTTPLTMPARTASLTAPAYSEPEPSAPQAMSPSPDPASLVSDGTEPASSFSELPLTPPTDPSEEQPNNATSEPVADPESPDSTPEPVAVAAPEPDRIALSSFAPERWGDVCRQLGAGGITGNLLINCIVEEAGSHAVTLLLDEGQSALFSEEQQHRITGLLSDYFGEPLSVVVKIGSPTAETPAARRQRETQERHAQAVRNFEQDRNVNDIIRDFSATIQPGSIVPLSK